MKKKSLSQFEVIFVSSDNEESTFKEYALRMPWIAVPFKDPKCQKLRQIYNISSMKIARREFLGDFLMHIHVLMLCRKFELIPIKFGFFMNF